MRKITPPPPTFFSKSLACLLVIFSVLLSFNSCKKEEKKSDVAMQEESVNKVHPNVPQCSNGYHWDYNLMQCVPNCPSGYIYDPITNDCIPNEPSGGSRIYGAEFNQFNLGGYTLSQVIEYMGVKHNEYQDFIYNGIMADTSVLTNGTLQAFLKQKTTTFFNGLGITEANNPLPGNFDILDTSFVISGYSATATSILNQLKNISDGFENKNYIQIQGQLENLKQQALNLPDFTEALAVASCISVAKYSYQYWTYNLTKWYAVLHLSGSGYANKQAPCGINVKKIGGADIKGAFVGGRIGLAAGAPGVFAGAILSSAVFSSGRVLWEAAKCIPYVGGIIRWLDDWF